MPETEVLPVAITPEVNLGVVQANTPSELVAVATDAANALAGVIESKKLYNTISGRRYVRVEGWTTLAAMLGCLPREVSVTRDEAGTYTATVELARMSDGAILTRASAECGMDEKTWAERADYARRSMAVTRATSKACRIAFSWVMVLAGYEVVPAEEVPPGGFTEPKAEKAKDGAPMMPFGKTKGKLLSEHPSDELIAVRDWCKKKDAVKFAQLCEQIDDVLAARQGE